MRALEMIGTDWQDSELERSADFDLLSGRVLRKVSRRILPLLFLLYLLAYLDRINVGFAQLQMESALGFGDTVYGFGAGIFFIGFALFEIPSNLILHRLGARLWIGRIMVSWGVISTGMAFIQTPTHFYVMRFLLGVAEAGFFPGVIFYLSQWFPDAHRARAISLFMMATAFAGVVGGPLSGHLLRLDGLCDLDGWQWIFLVEGLPSVFLGFLMPLLLANSPGEARWLTPDERKCISLMLSGAHPAENDPHLLSLKSALASRKVWKLALLYFCLLLNFNTLGLWMPQIMKTLTRSNDFETTWLVALPFLVATVAMAINGLLSDRHQERQRYIRVPTFMAALGLILVFAEKNNNLVQIAGLCLAVAGVWSTLGPFWALPASLLRGRAAAGGIALINSIGAIGGFVGPNFAAFCLEAWGTLDAVYLSLAAVLVIAGASTRTRDDQSRSGSLSA